MVGFSAGGRDGHTQRGRSRGRRLLPRLRLAEAFRPLERCCLPGRCSLANMIALLNPAIILWLGLAPGRSRDNRFGTRVAPRSGNGSSMRRPPVEHSHPYTNGCFKRPPTECTRATGDLPGRSGGGPAGWRAGGLAGGGYSTARDLNAFAEALKSGRRLKPQTLNQLKAEQLKDDPPRRPDRRNRTGLRRLIIQRRPAGDITAALWKRRRSWNLRAAREGCMAVVALADLTRQYQPDDVPVGGAGGSTEGDARPIQPWGRTDWAVKVAPGSACPLPHQAPNSLNVWQWWFGRWSWEPGPLLVL